MSSLRFNRPPDFVEAVRLTGDLAGPGFLILDVQVEGVQAIWRGPTTETFLIVRTTCPEESHAVGHQFCAGNFRFATKRSIVIERKIVRK